MYPKKRTRKVLVTETKLLKPFIQAGVFCYLYHWLLSMLFEMILYFEDIRLQWLQ